MAFKKADRQKIIDGYLAKSGANMFGPAGVVDWLSCQPGHEAYEWFFGMDDATAAREHRILMARQMANGLRIVSNVTEAKSGNVVSVHVREFPAFISPMSGRGSGGGYEPFDPSNGAQMDELRRQGATALRAWLARYRGAFADADLTVIEKIAASEDGRVALSA
jgi:hypothetical protein